MNQPFVDCGLTPARLPDTVALVLRVLLQRLVRWAPVPARAIWTRLPAGLRERLGSFVHPIAAGARGSGWILAVPWPGARPELGKVDLRGSSIDAEVAYLDMTRGRRSDDGVYVLGPADPRTTPLRQFGLRSLGEGDGSDVDSVGKFPAVCLVIVTFDNPSLLASCLDSIAVTTAWPNLAIVVVDNGADPRTRAAVERPRGLDVRWVTSGGNIGFARAINRGAREVAGDYLVLLNDDTVMAPGCIARLVSHLEADPDLGLVCPVSNEIGNEARVQVGYHDFDTMVEESRMRACEYRGRIRSTEVVPLFCAAMRRRVFDECGGLDGRYEVGMFEDDDLSRTLRTKGYRLGIADDCFVHHVGQASFGRLSDQAYLKIWEANKARYEQKWGRRWRPPLGGEDA